MPSDPLFAGMFTEGRAREAVSGRAWVQAMLDFEAALAEAEARLGLVPASDATLVRAVCRAELFDIGRLGEEAAHAANPAGPLVEAIRAKLPAEVAGSVHLGATSQDALDTAMMLVALRAGAHVLTWLAEAGALAAALAEEHADLVMAGRTLLQQAVPVTFGLKAAGWLAGLAQARQELDVRLERLPVQFGGAAGTLAALGGDGPAVAAELGRGLGLRVPPLPWHTNRVVVASLGAALGVACGVCAKIATDVVLLSQGEVGEVSEGGGGGSSVMPQKRNPARAVAVRAGAARAQALVPILLHSMAQEHERAAGAWQAEWEALSELLELTAGVAANTARMLRLLEVHPERMRQNLEATKGLVMAEAVTVALSRRIGGMAARQAVDAAVATAGAQGLTFREALSLDQRVVEALGEAGIDATLAPERYLGSARTFIDNARALFETPGG